MAAFFQNGVVSPKQEFVEFQAEYEEEVEQEFDEVLVEPHETEQSPSSAVPTVILALPNASASTVVDDSPEPKRDQMEEKNDSRKMFQRLWTDEDEIVILQGFLDYNANRGSSYHNDTGSFYDQIKSKIQLDFNKSQLVDKLRRLKKKYRNVLQKFDSGKEFIFKTPHDQATFEISHKIWNNVTPIAVGVPVEDDEEISPNPNPNSAHMITPVKNELINEKKTAQSRKRSRVEEKEKRELNDFSALTKDNHNNSANNNSSNVDDENGDKSNGSHTHNIPGLIEETVKSCLTPLLKELSSRNTMGSPFGFGGRGFSLDPMPFSFLNFGNGEKVMDEKWKKQQILELEVYSKRLELVQDEIRVALEELRSSSGAGARGGNNHQ
jgi:hypothetical protein